MMVVGWAVLSLWGKGDVSVLDHRDGDGLTQQERDEERVGRWLGGAAWRVSEGLGREWESFSLDA
jgi:uroporphyrin-III C-methyltransferase